MDTTPPPHNGESGGIIGEKWKVLFNCVIFITQMVEDVGLEPLCLLPKQECYHYTTSSVFIFCQFSQTKVCFQCTPRGGIDIVHFWVTGLEPAASWSLWPKMRFELISRDGMFHYTTLTNQALYQTELHPGIRSNYYCVNYFVYTFWCFCLYMYLFERDN